MLHACQQRFHNRLSEVSERQYLAWLAQQEALPADFLIATGRKKSLLRFID